MRPLGIWGIVLMVLGLISFFVPIPVSKEHDVKVGSASIGVTTHHDEKLSPVVGGMLCAVGVVLLVAGSRKAT
jgi:hypothetical protein